MKQLSGIDAAFLNLEMQRTPMHIGGVYIFRGQAGESAFDFERFRAHMRSRVSVSPVFRRRVLEVPLNLDHPYWIEDSDFDMDLHLQHVGLPYPGGLQELLSLAAQQLARPLDRSRPLWELTFVEGLRRIEGVPDGSVALIAKVHHAAVDGISGVEIMAALLDYSSEPRHPDLIQPWLPDGIPNPLQLLSQGIKATLRSPPRGYALVRTLGLTLGRSIKERIVSNSRLPQAIFSAPYAVTNGAVSSHRVFGGAQLPLSRINRVRQSLPGTTMNDVVLTICAGALRHYLEEREILPDESLVAMAPISVRRRHEQNAGGNRIFAMLVSLATQEDQPLRRLARVQASVRAAMQYKKAVEAAHLAENLPALVSAMATRWYIRNQISQKHRPWFNVVITNVPGPSRPLYMAGAELLTQWGSGPIIDGVGLIIVVTSYAGSVGFGLTSCKEIIPDMNMLTQYLYLAMDELEAAAVEVAKNVGAVGQQARTGLVGNVSRSPDVSGV